MTRIFRNRKEAGQKLANALTRYANRDDVVVLALPRGGVPVAHEVAQKIQAPLDVFMVRKLGLPGHEELAMGAIATGGVRVLNQEVVDAMHVSNADIEMVAAEEERELRRRELAYRGHEGTPEVHGKVVILIDDGIATGATMKAAIQALRKLGAARLVVATPVVAASTAVTMRRLVDDFVVVLEPEDFHAVGQWYADFPQTTDEEVTEVLEKSGLMAGSSKS